MVGITKYVTDPYCRWAHVASGYCKTYTYIHQIGETTWQHEYVLIIVPLFRQTQRQKNWKCRRRWIRHGNSSKRTSPQWGSNSRPLVYETSALSTELWRPHSAIAGLHDDHSYVAAILDPVLTAHTTNEDNVSDWREFKLITECVVAKVSSKI